MKKFAEWKQEDPLPENSKTVTQEEFVNVLANYATSAFTTLKTFAEHCTEDFIESVETTRYSVEVNFRTNMEEALEGYAKILLGYVSAAMKTRGYHTKHVFTEKPLRLMVSSRNWDDGEWVVSLTWNHEHNCFVISKGFYNKDRRTVSIQQSHKSTGTSAAEISKEIYNLSHHLKDQPDNHEAKRSWKPVNLRPGPKK